MKKVLGIFGLLVVVMAGTWAMEPKFMGSDNLQNIARLTGMYGIMAIGEAFVIITGGIDLSVGAVVGLIGSLLPLFLRVYGMPVWAAISILIALSMGIGFLHGMLITKLRLQPFVVTLCGLFIYRGMARFMTGDATQGFGMEYEGLKKLATYMIPVPFTNGVGIPVTFVELLIVAALATVLLNFTVYGRYIYALGRNEVATRYSGINTDRMVILSYMISSTMAGGAAVLFVLYLNSVQPSGHGNFFELYAVAGCVLGGCSLRGGEGTILGVIIGTAILRVLYNAINMLGIATQLEFAVIGIVILTGVIADEMLKRVTAARRAARS